ncbi:MAG TPA: NAD-dependent epimerase/dehydratase family protein, partial [Candidatus Paceibacterota bacterium]
MSERYLIFGNGFIAEHYTKHLTSRGEIVLLAFHSKKNPRIPSSMQRKASKDIEHVQKMLKAYNPHFIILTQGISFIPDNEKELRRSIESNIFSPLLILEAAYRLRSEDELKSLKKIVTFGSAAEYGNSDTKRWTETSKDTKPNSFYGLVKHWLFDTVRFYQQSGLPCVHLRHFNAVGAGQDARFVVSAFCKQVAMMERGTKPRIVKVGDLTQRRDFIDIRDAVAAYDLVLKHGKPGQAINICSGKVNSVKKILDILQSLTTTSFTTNVDQ